MRPQAFLFDMDGLLIDSERVYCAVARDLLGAQGHNAAEVDAFFLTMIGVSGPESLKRLAQFLGSDAAAQAFDVAWHAEVGRRLAAGVPLRPTVADSLARLAGQGARMAVVTSTNGQAARKRLAETGIAQHFELVIGGDEAPARKPDPAPYLAAAAGLGLAPGHCAAFEDSDHGITAAARAGCIAVQVPDLRPSDVPLPSLGQHVAQDLAHALEAVNAFT